jgi:hypothetical protein
MQTNPEAYPKDFLICPDLDHKHLRIWYIRSGPHAYFNLVPNLSRTGPLLCTTINRNQREGDKEAQDPQEDGER